MAGRPCTRELALLALTALVLRVGAEVGDGATVGVPEDGDPVREFQDQVSQLQTLATKQHEMQRDRLEREKASLETKLLEHKYQTKFIAAGNAKLQTNLTELQARSQDLLSQINKLNASNQRMHDILDRLSNEVGSSHQFVEDTLVLTNDENATDLQVPQEDTGEPTLAGLLAAVAQRANLTQPSPPSLFQVSTFTDMGDNSPADSTEAAEPGDKLWEAEPELRQLGWLQQGTFGNLTGLWKQLADEEEASRLRLRASFLAAQESETEVRKKLIETQQLLEAGTSAEVHRVHVLEEGKVHMAESNAQLRQWLEGVGAFARGVDTLLDDAVERAKLAMAGH